MKIIVTKSDIARANASRNGKKHYEPACHCPIARAVKRTKKIQDVLVGKHAVHVSYFKPHLVYILPEKAKKFIRNYDKKLAVKPFSFSIIPIKQK